MFGLRDVTSPPLEPAEPKATTTCPPSTSEITLAVIYDVRERRPTTQWASDEYFGDVPSATVWRPSSRRATPAPSMEEADDISAGRSIR